MYYMCSRSGQELLIELAGLFWLRLKKYATSCQTSSRQTFKQLSTYHVYFCIDLSEIVQLKKPRIVLKLREFIWCFHVAARSVLCIYRKIQSREHRAAKRSVSRSMGWEKHRKNAVRCTHVQRIECVRGLAVRSCSFLLMYILNFITPIYFCFSPKFWKIVSVSML